MKKLVSAAVIAALVAGAANAEVKLSANARVQSNILKSTLAKSDSDSNHNDWFNLKGWGDAKDTVSINASEDFGGLSVVTVINSTTADEKYATFDTYKAWLTFGNFKLSAGKFGTRNADRPRNQNTDVSLLDGKPGKWGVNPDLADTYGTDFDNITAVKGTSKLSFLGEYTIKDALPGTLTIFGTLTEDQSAAYSYTTKTTTETETTISEDGKTATSESTSTSETSASSKDSFTYYHNYSKNTVFAGFSAGVLYNQKDMVKVEALGRFFTEDILGAGLYADLLMVENLNLGLGFTFVNDSTTENAKKTAWAVQTMTSYKISKEMIATLQARFSNYKKENEDAETSLEVVAGGRYVASDTLRVGLEAGLYMTDLDNNDKKATGKNHVTVFPTVQVNSGKNAYFCTGVNFDTKLDTGDMKDSATVTTITVPFILRVKM